MRQLNNVFFYLAVILITSQSIFSCKRLKTGSRSPLKAEINEGLLSEQELCVKMHSEHDRMLRLAGGTDLNGDPFTFEEYLDVIQNQLYHYTDDLLDSQDLLTPAPLNSVVNSDTTSFEYQVTQLNAAQRTEMGSKFDTAINRTFYLSNAIDQCLGRVAPEDSDITPATLNLAQQNGPRRRRPTSRELNSRPGGPEMRPYQHQITENYKNSPLHRFITLKISRGVKAGALSKVTNNPLRFANILHAIGHEVTVNWKAFVTSGHIDERDNITRDRPRATTGRLTVMKDSAMTMQENADGSYSVYVHFPSGMETPFGGSGLFMTPRAAGVEEISISRRNKSDKPLSERTLVLRVRSLRQKAAPPGNEDQTIVIENVDIVSGKIGSVIAARAKRQTDERISDERQAEIIAETIRNNLRIAQLQRDEVQDHEELEEHRAIRADLYNRNIRRLVSSAFGSLAFIFASSLVPEDLGSFMTWGIRAVTGLIVGINMYNFFADDGFGD